MSRMIKGKRKTQRTSMVVPVRVRLAGTSGRGEAFLAHTLDASETGVRLAGFRGELNVQDAIEIQYRHKWTLFRVVWIRPMEKSSEKQIGAECMESDKNIWGAEFAQAPDEYEDKQL